jgi:metallophosphoesterase (TIGR00282 family)
LIRILSVGDIITPSGTAYLASSLWRIRREEQIDFVTVNTENASFLGGINPTDARTLLDGGADCLTGGNHTLQTKSTWRMLDESPSILRPINYPDDGAPGSGYTILPAGGCRVLVISALGTVYMDPGLESPLPKIERILAREAGRYDLAIVDFHAEASGEKLAVAYALDGRVAAFFGTHTHVQTADEQILPGGTGYLTDLGMCGPAGGVLGVSAEVMAKRIRTGLKIPYAPADGEIFANGAIFDLDERTGKCLSVRRVTYRDR